MEKKIAWILQVYKIPRILASILRIKKNIILFLLIYMWDYNLYTRCISDSK